MKKINHRQKLIEKMGRPVVKKALTCDSIRTTYLTTGDGFPVVLLHGAGAGAVTWYPSIDAIARNFRVLAPDIVGYGESDKPDALYDRAYFSDWLKAFLSELGEEKVHLVGLSQGGAIAIQFALDNPDMVDKLVLVNSGGLGARPSFWSMLGMIWMNSFPSLLSSRFNSQYLLSRPESRDPSHIYYSIEVLKKPGGKKAFTQGRGAAVSAIPEDSLAQITHQTLVIVGENDRLFSSEYGERANQTIPNAELIRIQDAGHLPLMDQPEVFNQALCAFLGR
ncbi:alpha/beta fold hydrolase [Vibrio diazotrophicus]|uniref:alpha/beta fold hydrolase n=1 Tax=Vibrio diazotrophicus TaxID=685 RepID=UPI0005AB4FFA|nr:alpha/beta hydrolase [Vibrio diazotrophicus]